MNARLLITIVSNIFWEGLIVTAAVWGLPRLGVRIPLWGIVLITIAFAIYAAVLYRLGTRTLGKKALPGSTSMIGVSGRVTRPLAPNGFVKIQGELWEATAEKGPIEGGIDVIVVGQKGFKLVVRVK